MNSAAHLQRPEIKARMIASVRRSNRERVRPIEERFHEKYIPEPNSGCWLWTAATNLNGYGVIAFNGRRAAPATHVALYLDGRAVPSGLCALHRCDTPACVNPSHLFIGTKLDNARDAKNKGRHARYWLGKKFTSKHLDKLRSANAGENNNRAKLTREQVQEIRSSAEASGALAKRFGVSAGTIWEIRTGRKWAHP